MDREIRCYLCDTYLGVIRDGKLHKQIRFTCYSCSDDYIPEPVHNRRSAEDDASVEKLMRMFGMTK